MRRLISSNCPTTHAVLPALSRMRFIISAIGVMFFAPRDASCDMIDHAANEIGLPHRNQI